MADVDGNLYQWSTTAANNKPTGATSISTGLDDNLRELAKVVRQDLAHKGADIASVAGTTDIGAVPGLMHDITGAETITGFGTVSAGIWKILKFEGAASVTHNATSMILLGGASRTMANGDVQIVISEGSGNWRELAYFAAANGPSKVLQAAVAATSGTTKDFTIPAWAKRVTVMIAAVSLDGTEELLVQLGDSGGVETASYVGNTSRITAAGTSTEVLFTSGFALASAGDASHTYSGALTLTLMDASTNTWIASGTISLDGGGVMHIAGYRALDGVLTTVRLTSTGTPDDFDGSGSVSVLVE